MTKLKKLFESLKAIYDTYFRRTEIHKMVAEFRQASGSPLVIGPQNPDDDRVRLAARLIVEEAFETIEAMFGNDEALLAHKEAVTQLVATLPVGIDMIEVADGLGDTDYVVEWARQEFGIDGLPVAEEIQRTNMAKLGPGAWVRESDGKQMKPPGWTPPDIKGVLEKQGWVSPLDDPTGSGV